MLPTISSEPPDLYDFHAAVRKIRRFLGIFLQVRTNCSYRLQGRASPRTAAMILVKNLVDLFMSRYFSAFVYLTSWIEPHSPQCCIHFFMLSLRHTFALKYLRQNPGK